VDGNFLLAGLRVREGSFDGMLEEMDDTPNTPDQMGVWVRGRFSGQQRHASGTIQAGSRSCDSYQQLSFTARRVRSLPARPVNGRQYAGRTVRGSAIGFRISRSGRRLIGFRVAPVATSCTIATSGAGWRSQTAGRSAACGTVQTAASPASSPRASRHATPLGRGSA
jgi:hypothetical protein